MSYQMGGNLSIVEVGVIFIDFGQKIMYNTAAQAGLPSSHIEE